MAHSGYRLNRGRDGCPARYTVAESAAFRSALTQRIDDVTTWLGSVEESRDTAVPQNGLGPNDTSQDDTNGAPDSPSTQGAQLMNPLAVDAGNYLSDSSGRPGMYDIL